MDVSQAKDWLELVVRWAHLIFGAAWIGTSFYFNWLNHSFRPPEDPDSADPGVNGEVWAVHGGEFFRVTKYAVAPAKLPSTLHWFKWEAYLTWISGACLLAIVYYHNEGFLLGESAPYGMLPTVGIGIGSLILGWFAYDLLCRSPLGRNPLVFAIVGFALMTGAAFGLTQVLGSRAAYIHVGAMIGTIMAFNVFRVIIPNQRITVGAMERGDSPDPKYGHQAAQRSLHNNYLTLPVLFIMVSNHYPFTYGHEWNWAVLAGIALIGAGVRHYFNLKNKGRDAVWILPVAAVAMAALAFVSTPTNPYKDLPAPVFSEVRSIIERRCVECHSQSPTSEIYQEAPQGVMFDNIEQIRRYAPRIHTQVVVSKAMPLANMTQITEEERAIIGAWYFHGAEVSGNEIDTVDTGASETP